MYKDIISPPDELGSDVTQCLSLRPAWGIEPVISDALAKSKS